MRRPLALLLLFLVAPLLPAQARRPFVGRVLRADATPAAAAEVTFTATAPEGEAFLATEVVRVVADGGGRFRAELQVGRDYSASAIAATADADGLRRGSPVHDDLDPGHPVDFVLSSPCRARALVVAHAAAWRACGERLQVRVGVHARNFHAAAVPVADDGTVAAPLLPAVPGWVQVLDAAGEVVWQGALAAEAGTVPLPPPQPLPVRVLDDTGRPVAEATVLTQVEGFRPPAAALAAWPFRLECRNAGRTDAKGQAVVHVARAVSPMTKPAQPRLLVVAQKAGHAEGYAGFDGERFEDNPRGGLPDRLTLVLGEAAPVRGVVRGRDGAPVAGAPVSVRAHFGVQLGDLQGNFDRTWSVRTDRDGRFALGDVPPRAVLSHLVVGGAAAAPSLLPLLLHPDQVAGSRELEVDARTMRGIAVQATDADGGPAAHAVLRVQPLAGDSWWVSGHVVRLDAAGRGTVLLPPGGWLLAANDGRGHAEAVVAATAGASALDLRLVAMPQARFLVLGPDQRPVAGATAAVMQIGSDLPPNPLREVQGAVRFWLDPVLVLRQRSGADGLLRLPFVPQEPEHHVRCTITAPGCAAVAVELVATDAPVEVRLPAASRK